MNPVFVAILYIRSGVIGVLLLAILCTYAPSNTIAPFPLQLNTALLLESPPSTPLSTPIDTPPTPPPSTPEQEVKKDKSLEKVFLESVDNE